MYLLYYKIAVKLVGSSQKAMQNMAQLLQLRCYILNLVHLYTYTLLQYDTYMQLALYYLAIDLQLSHTAVVQL
jgi:hypothetical protein